MAIRIKALDEQEFNEAAAGSYVYGKFSGYVDDSYHTTYVYVENLGEEKPDSGREKDKRTQHKFFASGEIYYAETEEALDNGEFGNENNQPYVDSVILLW